MAQRPLVGRSILIIETSWSYTLHTRLDFSARVISPRQRLLYDNTKLPQETDIHAPVRFEPTIPASERPQTHALDRAATGNGNEYE